MKLNCFARLEGTRTPTLLRWFVYTMVVLAFLWPRMCWICAWLMPASLDAVVNSRMPKRWIEMCGFRLEDATSYFTHRCTWLEPGIPRHRSTGTGKPSPTSSNPPRRSKTAVDRDDVSLGMYAPSPPRPKA